MHRATNAQFEANPIGTRGIKFVEFFAANSHVGHSLFLALGFTPTLKHKSKDITVYQQGSVKFILNNDTESVEDHLRLTAIGVRVNNASEAYHALVERGAVPYKDSILRVPAITGVGNSLIYIVDDSNGKYADFEILNESVELGKSLVSIESINHNVLTGNAKQTINFYEHLFDFRLSEFLYSPCGKIKISINEEPTDGIQSVTLAIKDYDKIIKTLPTQNSIKIIPK